MARNVEWSVKANKLTIVVDLTKDFGPSASGKTTIIGTTQGSVDIEAPGHEGVKLGVNVYKSKK